MTWLKGRRGHALALAALLLIELVFFWDLVIGGQEPLAPDNQAWRPLGKWRDQVEATLDEAPLWCPSIFSGMPAEGSFITTRSAPLDLLRQAREATGNHFGLSLYLYLIVGSVALYVWLAWRGRSPLAALGGALVLGLTPYLLGMIAAGHNTKIRALYLAPVVLLALETLLRRRTLAAAAFLGLALAYQLWANHPQITYYTVLFAGLYALGVLLFDRPEPWRGAGLGWGLALGLLAVVLAGALILHPYATVLEYSPHSIRGATSALAAEADVAGGAGWDYATAWSYPPQELIAFLFPAWFGLEGGSYWGALPFTQSTHYLGAVALLLGALGLALGGGRRRWIFAGLALVLLVIGFGRHLPVLYRPMYLLLPMFKSFRVPSMIYALLPLAAAPLVARGLDAVMDAGFPARVVRAGRKAAPAAGGPRRIDRWPLVTAGLVGLLLLWLVAGGALVESLRGAGAFLKGSEAAGLAPAQLAALRDLPAAQLRSAGAGIIVERMELLRGSVAIGLALLAACAGVIEARRRGWLAAPAAGLLLCVVLVADLWIIDRKFYAPEPAEQSDRVLQADELIRFFQEQPGPFRVAPLRRTGEIAAREFGSNRYAAFGLETVGGYQAAKLRIYDDLIRAGALDRLPVLSMLNAAYLISDQPLDDAALPPAARLRGPGGGEIHVHRNPGGAERAWFVARVQPLPDDRAVLAALSDPGFAPHTTALAVAGEADGLPAAPSAGRIELLETALHEIEARVVVAGPEPGLLVFSEIFYAPGWRLTIDGRPDRLRRVDHVLRAVVVPPGDHVVRMEAISPARGWGRRVSGVAGGVAVVLLAGAWLVRRLRPAPRGAAA